MAERVSFPGYPNSFRLLDTFGLPLLMQMDECESRGIRVALDLFVRDAVLAGWTFEKAMVSVREALVDKHGRETGEFQARRLERLMKSRAEEYWPAGELAGEVNENG